MARRSSLRFLVFKGIFALCVPMASIAAGLPDLVPREVKLNPSSITPGQSMRVSWTMANKGDGDAKASVTGLRLKPVGTCSEITLVQEIATPAIAAGGSINQQYDVTVPAAEGRYFVKVVADNVKKSTLGQKDQNNDYALSGEVTLSCPSAISTGRPLMADMELVDEGAFADARYPSGQTDKAEHVGTDYRAAGGSCVFAVREGKVESNVISTADPMAAVLTIKHDDGSRAYYGHIKSSLVRPSKVSRGALLGTVHCPTPTFASHLHYGEWEQPSGVIENPETDCEKEPWVTKAGNWGWGRVPLGTERCQMLKCGWIDTQDKYGWVRKEIPSTPIISSAQTIPDSRQVTYFGSFSNMVYTEEHGYGSEVSLWKAGDVIFGYFAHAEGPLGILPKGIIENIAYDIKSGALSFQTKLSMGEHSCAIHHGVPSYEIFKFEGKLIGEAISGTVSTLNALHQNRLECSEKITLKKVPSDGLKPQNMTYADWITWAKRIGVKVSHK